MNKIEKEKYESDWGELSWHIQDAIWSFSAMLGWNEWQKIQIQSKQVFVTDFTRAEGVISNALYTHCFLLAPRIYDCNSKLSLCKLYNKATSSNLLASDKQALADNLSSSIFTFYKQLCIVRDKIIAHVDVTKKNAFQILQEQGISRENVLNYLDECNQLFWLLGEPIGKTHDKSKLDCDHELFEQMKKIHSVLAPIE